MLEIRGERCGRPSAAIQITAVDGGVDVTVVMGYSEQEVMGSISKVFYFGIKEGYRVQRRIEISLAGAVIGVLADFLGPIEDATE